jgi:tetratricopeptide (TPR) repeat protein
MNLERRRCLLAFALALWAALSCGRDAADQEHFAVLEGDEKGMSQAEMRARMDHAIALAPDRVSYWETRAGLRRSEGDVEGAEADLSHAITLADRPYLRYLRGLVRGKRGDFAAAKDDLGLAIATQPENRQFYRGRALVLVSLRDLEAARADAEHLLRMSPSNAESLYVRGRVSALAGRPREAIADYDDVLGRRPELAYVRRDRATAYEALGEPESAAGDRGAARAAAEAGAGCGVCGDPWHP